MNSMKKVIPLILLALQPMVANVQLFAYDFQYGGIYYDIEKDHATVTYGNSVYKGRIDIPDQVTYNGKVYSVTSIGISAFEGGSDITYLSIPSSIIYIGEYAFIDCGNNIEVNISSLEAWCRIKFGNVHSSPLSSAKAFYLNGSEVKNLEIPDGVTSIPNYSFYQCKIITSLNIPASVNSIGSSAFEDCTGLTSVSLSNGLTLIGGSAFEGCKAVSSITIPSSVTTIAINAFNGCTRLNNITSDIQRPFPIDESVFCTYSSATLTVPYGTKSAYKNTAEWNKFQNIVEGDSYQRVFEENGITYFGTASTLTAVVQSVSNSLKNVIIPESIYYNGKTYQVTAVDDQAFTGLDVNYISLPTTVASVTDETFSRCNMGALIWNAEMTLPGNTFSNASIGANFLLYVKSASYAPSSVKNVVVNGTALSIVLSDDGGQFYCPQAFTALSISYTHNYSMETGGNGKGWETLVLPFDVQKISHSSRGEIVPFASYSSGSSLKPFWLGNFSDSGFRRASSIMANEPYIIAMPNSSNYRSEYNLAGDVTFSSENVQVLKTPSFSGMFLPAFATVERSSTVYALNVNNHYVKYSGNFDAGSRFISNLRDVRPFEAYISEGSSRGFIDINIDDSTMEIVDILIFANKDQKITTHTLSGQLVECTSQRDFNHLWSRIPRGVYIVNGKKWIK